jgi:hypothetical protein
MSLAPLIARAREAARLLDSIELREHASGIYALLDAITDAHKPPTEAALDGVVRHIRALAADPMWADDTVISKQQLLALVEAFAGLRAQVVTLTQARDAKIHK